MNIAFFVPHLKKGGAERVISILANELSERNHNVHICFISENMDIKSQYFIKDSVNLSVIRNFKFKSFGGIKSFYKSLNNYLVKNDIEVAISFSYVVAAKISLACKKFDIPIVFSERSDPSRKNYNGKKGIWKYVFFKNISNVVFQTEKAKSFYPEKQQKHSLVILNPVNLDSFPLKFIGERKKEIVSVGRLFEMKRYDVLIDAFTKIANKHTDYVLKIYGEGPLRKILQEQIERSNVKDRIFLMGKCDDIFNAINQASAFVFTSDYEGLPNALIEAMLLGLPCVSTRCSPGGAEELIQHEVNGLLVKCGDSEDVADKIDKILSDKSYAELLGNNATKLKERVDVTKIVNKWESYLVNSIDRNKSKK